MRASRERGEHGTENASSCSGPNGDTCWRTAQNYPPCNHHDACPYCFVESHLGDKRFPIMEN